MWMRWVEIDNDGIIARYAEVDEDGPVKPDDFFDFPYEYWMDVVDPRGKYLAEYQDYIMSGGGWY